MTANFAAMITKAAVILLLWAFALPACVNAEVLIVADEFPAMEALAARLKAEANTGARVIDQARMPESLSEFHAVVIYIHKELGPAAERAFIEYAESGGRLVLLHHSISSGKRQNKDWFRFLEVELPTGPAEQGGYKWIEGVTVDWVNLAPNQFVMTNHVAYTGSIARTAENGTARSLPAFTLRDTEVYLNHVLKGPHAVLMGLRYTDEKTGRVWVQDTAGWSRRAGKGYVFYFMPGHTLQDISDAVYGRILVNAITAELKALP
jgi:hypothetical protein